MRTCKAKTKHGEPCTAPGVGASGYCYVHDPARGAERAAARARGGHNRRAGRGVPAAEWPAVHDLASVLELVNVGVRDCAQLENSVARGRLVVALASVAVEVLRVGELETRLAAVEAALKAGRGNGNQ